MPLSPSVLWVFSLQSSSPRAPYPPPAGKRAVCPVTCSMVNPRHQGKSRGPPEGDSHSAADSVLGSWDRKSPLDAELMWAVLALSQWDTLSCPPSWLRRCPGQRHVGQKPCGDIGLESCPGGLQGQRLHCLPIAPADLRVWGSDFLHC